MRIQEMQRACRALCVLATLVVVQGCGGGGGGTGGNGTPEVETLRRNTPLRLEVGALGTQLDVPARAQEYVESPMQVALHAIKEVSALAKAGTLQMQVDCARYALADADGNGTPSAGDTVTIQYSACNVARLDQAYTGTLTVRLTSVDNAALGVLSGTVDFGAGLVPTERSYGTWMGSLNFRRTDDLAKEQLDISPTAADDLRIVYSQQSADAFQHPQLSRALRRDTARSSLTGTMTLSSDKLGGQVDIAAQLSSYIDSYFDSGSLRVSGAANTRITLPASAAGTRALQAELDSNGDGVADGSRTVNWDYRLMGRLLFEPTGVTPIDRDDTSLRLIHKPSSNDVDVSAPLRLQFDRPLSADNVVYVKLYEQGNTTNPPPEIAADAEILGGLLLVRPRATLRYGQQYGLIASNASDFSGNLILRPAAGTARFTGIGIPTGFSTDDTLLTTFTGAGVTSLTMPGRPITVTGSVPHALSLPLKYQWSQLSGPTVELGSPTMASTTVRMVDGSPPGVARATLQLKVTDAIGRSNTSPVEVQLANLTGMTTALYFSSGADNYVGGNQNRAFSTQTGTFEVYTYDGTGLGVLYNDVRPGKSSWSLQLSDASRRTPAVGSYTNAVATTTSEPGPRLTFSGDGRGCTGAGSFNVLEIEVDSLGTVRRLAVDFVYRCVVGTSLLGNMHGSVRLNSDLSIPR